MEGDEGDQASSAAGRKELLNRRLFHLKRFDSAEYFSTGDKNKFFRDLDKTEDYEKKHHLNHEHFETHPSPRAPASLGVGEHPLQQCRKGREELDDDRELGDYIEVNDGEDSGEDDVEESPKKKNLPTRKTLESEAGKRVLLRKKIEQNKRFDSGDYFRGVKPDEEIVGTGLGPAAKSQDVPKRHSAIMAQRFLKKREQRKRWDSADYNVLLDQGARFPSESKPDLDVMSVSSGEGVESKADEVGSDAGDLKDFKEVEDSHRFKTNVKLLSGRPPPLATTTKKNALQQLDGKLSQSAAKEHFLHHQKRQTRFDSADYFRGISPPSQELNCDPWSEPPGTPKTKLGMSTLAQRELRAEKARRERERGLSN